MRKQAMNTFDAKPTEMGLEPRFANVNPMHDSRRRSSAVRFMHSDVRPRKDTTPLELSRARTNSLFQRSRVSSSVLVNAPKLVESIFNVLSSEKLFVDRRRASESYARRKSDGISSCLDLEWAGTAREYCEKSSMHGLQYVGDTKLSLIERFLWLATFVLGVLAAAYFITILYNRWNDNPMIITLSPKATSLNAVPFPAVTICNMNGARKSVTKLMNLSRNHNEESFEVHMLRKLCRDPIASVNVNGTWNEMQNFMIKVSQPCHSMLVSCLWMSKAVPCEDMFNPELTDEGMCCSFNKVKRDFIYRNLRQFHGMNYTFPYPGIDWTPEAGYPPDAPLDSNPWRVSGPGLALGLTIVLDAELFDYYCSSTGSVGFKVLLHSPVETPRVSEFAYFVTPGEETRVEIEPKISTTSPTLVNIPEKKRMCVFTSERNLRFYRTYTQRNCELECQSNFTLKECKCVPFYLPKDTTTRICGTADDDCVDYVKDVAEKRPLVNVSYDAERPVINCSCLPSCVQLFYTRKMSTGKLEDSFKIRKSFLKGKTPSYYKRNMAVVHFFFVESSFTSVEKGEIFGFTDFLSNTGGLLGLFLGFSFLSAAEIGYFLTIKLLGSRRKKRRRGSTEILRKSLPFAK